MGSLSQRKINPNRKSLPGGINLTQVIKVYHILTVILVNSVNSSNPKRRRLACKSSKPKKRILPTDDSNTSRLSYFQSRVTLVIEVFQVVNKSKGEKITTHFTKPESGSLSFHTSNP